MVLDVIKLILIVALVAICVSVFSDLVGFIAELISAFTGVLIFIPEDVLIGLRFLMLASLGLIVYNWVKGW